jgi:hypothetical protein
MGEPTPTSVYWKDDNVKDEGAPDPRTKVNNIIIIYS